jgi:hypothetical protein
MPLPIGPVLGILSDNLLKPAGPMVCIFLQGVRLFYIRD